MVAITAEPGGNEAIRKRLSARNVPPLDFQVVSDPTHIYLKDEGAPQEWFITEKFERFAESGAYEMIQPALIVYHVTEGESKKQVIPECSWSWMRMGLSKVPKASTRVQGSMLVTVRPVMSDLVAAIQEKRMIQLATTEKSWFWWRKSG